MTSDLFFQSIVNGLTLSFMYILMALGLTLLFSMMHILNFAHGEVYMLGAFVAYYFLRLTLTGNTYFDYFLAMIVAVLAMGLLGLAIDKSIFRNIRGKVIEGLIATFGLSMFLQGIANWQFGIMSKSIPSIFSGVIEIGPARLSLERVVVIIGGMVLVAGLYYLMYRTKAGIAMRAASQEPDGAALQGISTEYICGLAFFISCVLAGAAGVLVAPMFLLYATMGIGPLFKAFMIIILGGVGSIPGCIVGGLVIGFMDAFLGILFGSEIGYAAGFAIIIIVILFRPRGILGHA